MSRIYGAVVGFLVLCWQYFAGGPGHLPVAVGVVAGLYAESWLWAGYLAGPARWFGLRAAGWMFGMGTPLRTSIDPRGVWQVRRIPVPVVRPLGLGGTASLTVRQLMSALLPFVGADVLCALLLASAGGAFGRSAALGCLLAGGAPVLMAVMLRSATEPGDQDGAVQEVTAVMQRDVAEARRLLDALPPGPAVRTLRMSVLLAEGRYRELVDAAAESAGEAADPAQQQLHARALAYLDETGEANDADREAFRTLYRAVRRAPRAYRVGSDLPALSELAEGRPGLAIDEARRRERRQRAAAPHHGARHAGPGLPPGRPARGGPGLAGGGARMRSGDRPAGVPHRPARGARGPARDARPARGAGALGRVLSIS
ncbi:hypothetical protein TR51_30495 [Kitasatospora griseola]|uniref:Uncharacterized protein n=1 Tax=Kitasatospora griseola TaxID=2064 RepID=A0A0D0N4S7_KITGR|nr:hypothetical protein [Kitasatospora griseola]KIQ63115.1 hypothetical protein TR51_30495 [Kitasatospora griseola]